MLFFTRATLQEDRSLKIIQVHSEDGGSYLCRVSNGSVARETNIFLNVLGIEILMIEF